MGVAAPGLNRGAYIFVQRRLSMSALTLVRPRYPALLKLRPSRAPSLSLVAFARSFCFRRGTNSSMLMLMLMMMLVQATEVASAAKRAQAHETPGRGDMLPRFEVRGLGGMLGFFERIHLCTYEVLNSLILH